MIAHLDDDRAQAYVDRLLPDDERRQCAAHLAGCDDCSLLVESYRALALALDDLAAPLPPADFTAGVMARIEAADLHHAADRRLALGILGAAAAAAAVLLVVAGASAWLPLVSRLGDVFAGMATAALVVRDVAVPVASALRVQILVGCAAVALPLLFALSRLVPRTAEAIA